MTENRGESRGDKPHAPDTAPAGAAPQEPVPADELTPAPTLTPRGTVSAAPRGTVSAASTWLPRVAGVLLVLCFAGISTVRTGFQVTFKSPFTRVDQGEANLWLATAFLLTPAAILIGYGFRAPLTRLVDGLHARITAQSPKERRTSLALLTFACVAAARVMNDLVLRGYPITDDEWAARFGGQALAQGKLLVPVPFSLEAFPTLYMYVRNDAITSMDWLGAQLAWAFDEATGTDHLIFALAAATHVPCIAYILAKRLSPTWGAFGAMIAFLSPMAFSLSMTTHGQLVSRASVALTLALHVWTAETWSLRRASLMGLALGGAFVARPVEAGAILGPFLLFEMLGAVKEGGSRRRALSAAAIAMFVPIAGSIAHSWGVTGTWLPPRLAEGARWTVLAPAPLWTRFGSNVAFNLLRLGVWFLGPFGILMVTLGVARDRFTTLLGAGGLLLLLGGLAHTFYGIHAVGPINQSAAVVPLSIVAAYGLKSLVDRARALGLQASPIVAVAGSAVAIVCVVFNIVHGAGLAQQAAIQRDVYAQLESAVPLEARPAVVLAPNFGRVWASNPSYAEVGSWVFEWRRPSPRFDEPITILNDGPRAYESVRAAFPERTILRLVRGPAGQPTLVRASAAQQPEGALPAPTASTQAAPAPSAAAPDIEALAVESFGDARSSLLECLRAERLERPGATGKLPARVQVDANGLVADVQLGASELRSAAFDDCARQALLAVTFPQTLALHDLSITYDLR